MGTSLGGPHRHGGRAHTAVLCLCALTHTYLLFSVFPYAGYFCLYLVNGGDDANHQQPLSVDTVGLYVGLLGSAFAAGRLLGFRAWKRARDQFGERTALLGSLSQSALFSLLFGTAKTFVAAIFWRFLLGCSNGMSGSIKRAAMNRIRKPGTSINGGEGSEGAADDEEEEEEEWAISWILAVMSLGVAFGPAASAWMSLYGGDSAHPYLPPNLFGALLCVASVVSVLAVVHPDDVRRELKSKESSSSPEGSGEARPLVQPKQPPTITLASQLERIMTVWKARSTRSHLLAYAFFSCCVSAIDEALPLFLIARTGGLQLPAPQIGLVLAVAGALTAMLNQSSIFKLFAENLGLYPALHLSSALANVPMVLLPVSLAFATLGASFGYIVLLFGTFRAFAFLYFQLMGNAVTRSVPVQYAAEASRFMMVSGLAARAVGPSVAGVIATTLAGHSWAIWMLIGLLSAGAAAFTFVLREAAAGSRRSLAMPELSQRRKIYLSQRQRARIFAQLWEVHYDHGSKTTGAKWRRAARKVVAVNRMAGDTSAHSGDDVPERKLPPKKISWADRTLRPGIDVDEVPFFIIGTKRSDVSVLTPPLMDALQDHFPSSITGFNYWMKFSLTRDGASLEALESKAGYAKHTILAIETLDGHVFGCYMGRAWEWSSRYAADGTSFLWRLKSPRSFDSLSVDDESSVEERAKAEEDIEVYNWTGKNYLCQLLAHDKLAVGGGSVDKGSDGFGFVINEQLERGSSCPCETYGNPCLVPGTEGGQFEVANIEVWALTPFCFEADAERSERNVRLREQSVSQMATSKKGADIYSTSSEWSQFM
ncbi:hypothetical protein ACHAXT_010929 [Thalassiosira profunda]